MEPDHGKTGPRTPSRIQVTPGLWYQEGVCTSSPSDQFIYALSLAGQCLSTSWPALNWLPSLSLEFEKLSAFNLLNLQTRFLCTEWCLHIVEKSKIFRWGLSLAVARIFARCNTSATPSSLISTACWCSPLRLRSLPLFYLPTSAHHHICFCITFAFSTLLSFSVHPLSSHC